MDSAGVAFGLSGVTVRPIAQTPKEPLAPGSHAVAVPSA
jgi:hypothetical protein